jgi:hypothetical protein
MSDCALNGWGPKPTEGVGTFHHVTTHKQASDQASMYQVVFDCILVASVYFMHCQTTTIMVLIWALGM